MGKILNHFNSLYNLVSLSISLNPRWDISSGIFQIKILYVFPVFYMSSRQSLIIYAVVLMFEDNILQIMKTFIMR